MIRQGVKISQQILLAASGQAKVSQRERIGLRNNYNINNENFHGKKQKKKIKKSGCKTKRDEKMKQKPEGIKCGKKAY